MLEGDRARNVLNKCCGKCVGSSNCTACTTCNYCRYCNSGGSCGVCGGGSNRRSFGYGNTDGNDSRSNLIPRGSVNKARYIQYYIDTKYVNVRSGPGTEYGIIDRLTYRTNIYVETFCTNGWCFIRYYKANLTLQSGYVANTYIAYYIF